jgi:hypothetical protein
VWIGLSTFGHELGQESRFSKLLKKKLSYDMAMSIWKQHFDESKVAMFREPMTFLGFKVQIDTQCTLSHVQIMLQQAIGKTVCDRVLKDLRFDSIAKPSTHGLFVYLFVFVWVFLIYVVHGLRNELVLLNVGVGSAPCMRRIVLENLLNLFEAAFELRFVEFVGFLSCFYFHHTGS